MRQKVIFTPNDTCSEFKRAPIFIGFTLVQVLNLNLPAVPQNYVKIYLDHFSLNNVS